MKSNLFLRTVIIQSHSSTADHQPASQPASHKQNLRNWHSIKKEKPEKVQRKETYDAAGTTITIGPVKPSRGRGRERHSEQLSAERREITWIKLLPPFGFLLRS